MATRLKKIKKTTCLRIKRLIKGELGECIEEGEVGALVGGLFNVVQGLLVDDIKTIKRLF